MPQSTSTDVHRTRDTRRAEYKRLRASPTQPDPIATLAASAAAGPHRHAGRVRRELDALGSRTGKRSAPGAPSAV
jgi:hypothetical protein